MKIQLPPNLTGLIQSADYHKIDGGKIYFGQADKDPRSYPVDIFLDNQLTVASPPFLYLKLGYLWHNGNIVDVYVEDSIGSVSMLITDVYNRQLAYLPSVGGGCEIPTPEIPIPTPPPSDWVEPPAPAPVTTITLPPDRPREQTKYVYLSDNFDEHNIKSLYFEFVNGRQLLDEDYLITDSLVSAVKSKVQMNDLKGQTLKILEFLNADAGRKIGFFGEGSRIYPSDVKSDTMQILFDDEYRIEVSGFGGTFFNDVENGDKVSLNDINQYKNLKNSEGKIFADVFEEAMKKYEPNRTVNLDTIEAGEIHEEYYNHLDPKYYTYFGGKRAVILIIVRPVVYTIGEIIGRTYTHSGKEITPRIADRKEILSYTPNFQYYLRNIGKDVELQAPVQSVPLSVWEVGHITDDYTQLIYKEHLWSNS